MTFFNNRETIIQMLNAYREYERHQTEKDNKGHEEDAGDDNKSIREFKKNLTHNKNSVRLNDFTHGPLAQLVRAVDS